MLKMDPPYLTVSDGVKIDLHVVCFVKCHLPVMQWPGIGFLSTYRSPESSWGGWEIGHRAGGWRGEELARWGHPEAKNCQRNMNFLTKANDANYCFFLSNGCVWCLSQGWSGGVTARRDRTPPVLPHHTPCMWDNRARHIPEPWAPFKYPAGAFYPKRSQPVLFRGLAVTSLRWSWDLNHRPSNRKLF